MSHEFTYDTFLLALTMRREARGEGRDGMRAVAHVIRNRHKAGWGTIYDCITRKNQFTSMSVPGDGQLTHWPKPVDFLNTLHDAKRVLDGQDGDMTEGALYYYNPATATSTWFKNVIVANPAEHPKTLTLGNHEFFK